MLRLIQFNVTQTVLIIDSLSGIVNGSEEHILLPDNKKCQLTVPLLISNDKQNWMKHNYNRHENIYIFQFTHSLLEYCSKWPKTSSPGRLMFACTTISNYNTLPPNLPLALKKVDWLRVALSVTFTRLAWLLIIRLSTACLKKRRRTIKKLNRK